MASEYAEALKELAGKGSVSEAARYYARNHKALPQKKVPEIVKELLDAKRADGLSAAYLSDLEIRLDRFANTFRTYIATLTTADIESWLRLLKTGPRSRNNYLGAVVTLFRFAKRLGYLPKDRTTEADGLSKAKETRGEVEILTPTEMTDLLNAADDRMIPFLAIGGFAGLRTESEIEPLDWQDVNFSEGHILVRATKAKTRQRRIVPMQPNLIAWLSPWRGATGPVVGRIKVRWHLNKLAEKAGFGWRKNALRHSYGSYRLAQIKNAAEVSLEMGNSPQQIFKHYREVVTEKKAADWFAIKPERAKNVLPMKAAK